MFEIWMFESQLASDLELLRSELEHAHTRVQAQDNRLQAMAATERRVLELEALLDTAQQQGRGRWGEKNTTKRARRMKV
jgi:DNA anti-recombination protein RmuC